MCSGAFLEDDDRVIKMNISKNSFYYEEAGSGQKIVGLTGTVSNTGKAELQPLDDAAEIAAHDEMAARI